MSEAENEVNVGKVTAKFAIKLVIWSVIFMVIGFVIVMTISSSKIEGIDDTEIIEGYKAIKSMVLYLVIADIVAVLLATKLSVGGAIKKVTLTDDNKGKILKNMMIVLIVVAILVFIIHTVIVKTIEKSIVEDTEFDSVSDAIKEIEDYQKNDEMSDALSDFSRLMYDVDFDEMVDQLKGFRNIVVVYMFDAVIYLAMIPFSKVLVKKKIESK